MERSGAAGARAYKGEVSYVYLGRGLTMPVADDRALACEPLGNHGALGMHILFGDGRVEWVTASKAVEILERLRTPATGAAAR
jgi:hypothetical protein